ncbi:MAG: helix-turn-helix domain-containing protein [Rhodospirillaceae bacterium]|nr:helix-turn-helix domain-containing protein [Rhodospirillaceae bacterium]
MAPAKTGQANAVRAVSRALHLLRTLNARNGASLNALAKAAGLNRGTAYRLLLTFERDGYVEKDADAGAYWLTDRVLGLSDGHTADGWLRTAAPDILNALSRRILWPVSLALPAEAAMVIKYATDVGNPLAVERMPSGARMPMAGSAAGRCYLAFCAPARRELLVDLVGRLSAEPRDAVARDARVFGKILSDARKRGFAALDGTHRVSNLAVPVLAGDEVVAALVMRYFTRAMTAEAAARTFLEPLTDAARLLGAAATGGARGS